jgi:hypothetical protein
MCKRNTNLRAPSLSRRRDRRSRRPGIQWLGEDRYKFILEGRDQAGNRTRRAKRWRGSYWEAEAAYDRWVDGLLTGTVRDLLVDWIQHIDPDLNPQSDKKRSTFNRYAAVARNHVSGEIGDHTVADLLRDKAILHQWQLRLRKNVARPVQAHAWRVLSLALDHAVSQDRIPYNPCRLAEWSGGRRRTSTQPTDLTPTAIRLFQREEELAVLRMSAWLEAQPCRRPNQEVADGESSTRAGSALNQGRDSDGISVRAFERL